VLAADNSQTALAVAACEKPALVLTDCTMPDGDGTELIRRLREQPETRHIPVVAMSAVRSVRQALDDVPFIEKPFDLEEVLEAVAVHTADLRLPDSWLPSAALDR
jgi:CheY-like chemotaxis protein